VDRLATLPEWLVVRTPPDNLVERRGPTPPTIEHLDLVTQLRLSLAAAVESSCSSLLTVGKKFSITV
jgi:hypothetical protein